MRIRKNHMEEEEILLMASVSDALAHPVRIKIFRFIMKRNKEMNPICNKDVVAEFDYAQATISQHIKTLIKSGLVDMKKKDKFSYYYANLGMLMKYLDVTKKFE